ncbi:hypothetical protein H310_01611 [Aphanomyces invadans]|uniref:Elongator complex protein 4 n=1 Tax=Aphanomyces invadans TaxID=157072 RepID=A0A024UTA0_9STRA|nr:hypothetical protein H310_01611 [Aphanomyces invadans]ETW09185.1 hypothetical protein H310_01611 [Aphanomyces invadans]|eukprot:XP_008862990.1 hypothetical protein H310_01611 [Aphanomyces invadans]
MSTFRRASAAAQQSPSSPLSPAVPSVRARGIKPFTNDQILTSSGLRELDAVLGGGYLLGSMVVVESSVYGSYGTDLARYFAAEGLANENFVYTDASLAATLPLELSTAQKQLKAALVAQPSNENSAPLTIAWQYEKYTADKPQLTLPKVTDTRFCHSFDLSKPIADAMKSTWQELSIDPSMPSLQSAYRNVFSAMQHALEVTHTGATDIVRFVLTDLAAPWLSDDMTFSHRCHLHQFLRAVRGLLARHRRRCICVLTVAAFALPTHVVRSIRHLGDYAFELTSFAGHSDQLPSELAEFNGLFFVHKVAHFHSITGHALDNIKLGIKRDRRKLKLEPLHLPPEGSRSQKQPDKASQPSDMSF